MAEFLKLQVPTDVHALAQLLCKLGIVPGPLKAARIAEDGQIDIWFIAAMGAARVKRASARLVRSPRDGDLSPRRAYLDLRVQNQEDLWLDIKDEYYRAAGLVPPWEYDGVSYIGITLYQWGEQGRCWDAGKCRPAGDFEIYYRLLPGDRERAIKAAQTVIDDDVVSRDLGDIAEEEEDY